MHSVIELSTTTSIELAKQIHADLGELPLIMDLDKAARYKQSVINIRDKYFIVYEPDNPRSWLNSEYVHQITRERVEVEMKRQEKLKRRVKSENTEPEKSDESRRARRKTKRAKIASLMGEDEENAANLGTDVVPGVVPGVFDASTQTEDLKD